VACLAMLGKALAYAAPRSQGLARASAGLRDVSRRQDRNDRCRIGALGAAATTCHVGRFIRGGTGRIGVAVRVRAQYDKGA